MPAATARDHPRQAGHGGIAYTLQKRSKPRPTPRRDDRAYIPVRSKKSGAERCRAPITASQCENFVRNYKCLRKNTGVVRERYCCVTAG